jgi:hypothetical protein
MAVVTIIAAADRLARLAADLGQWINVRLSRPTFNRLEVEMEGAAYPLARTRVEAKLRELGITDAELR